MRYLFSNYIQTFYIGDHLYSLPRVINDLQLKSEKCSLKKDGGGLRETPSKGVKRIRASLEWMWIFALTGLVDGVKTVLPRPE